jgi:hypothetical protein
VLIVIIVVILVALMGGGVGLMYCRNKKYKKTHEVKPTAVQRKEAAGGAGGWQEVAKEPAEKEMSGKSDEGSAQGKKGRRVSAGMSGHRPRDPLVTRVFLSHNWGKDEAGRDNHIRVAAMNQSLKSLEIMDTWFDEDDMSGNTLQVRERTYMRDDRLLMHWLAFMMIHRVLISVTVSPPLSRSSSH